ncbi:hypothetical protein GS610_05415 [Ruegeria sp. HKCCD6228]|uniref:terminase TerL endonuclease subunit n=1 Tax=Ruegeria sp. HKCCD6228 TaxID=2683001 RepID=UPI001492792F|nr:terminase TerL endonuclease subunit [Ruegeria sp. HKCCD6228]NOD96643.1 hypothetical protein [Ruegeria sp. HKCCD6228]
MTHPEGELVPDPKTLPPTACVDWTYRLQRGLIPISLNRLPIRSARAVKFGKIVDMLRVPDLPGQPAFGDLASSPWLRQVGMAIWGGDTIREAFVCVGKKNAKSAGGALLFLAAMILNKRPQASFTILSPTIQVSRLTFEIIAGAIRADDTLKQVFHIRDAAKEVEDYRNGSKLSVKALDASSIAGLRGSVLLDELWIAGEQASSDRLRAQIRGALAADPTAKLLYISTVSDTIPRGMFLNLLEYGRNVRDGKIVDDSFLPCFYEPWPGCPDPMKDESVWPRLLPSFPHIADLQFYRGAVREAVEAGPAAVQIARSQFFNVQPTAHLRARGWAVAQQWNKIANRPLPLPTILASAEHVAVGIDLGGASDWSSLGVIGVMPDGQWQCWQQSWFFQSAYDMYKRERTNFDRFLAHGDLKLVEPGEDIRQILELMEFVKSAGNLHGVGVDPYGSSALVDAAERAGFSIDGDRPEVMGVRQSVQALNDPITRLERQVLEGKLIADNGPALTWAMGNAVVLPAGASVKLEREEAAGKIDPVAALIDAAGALVMRRPERIDIGALIG